MLLPFSPLLYALLLLTSSVRANQYPHTRRSLSLKSPLARRQGLFGGLGTKIDDALPKLTGILDPNGSDNTGDGPSTDSPGSSSSSNTSSSSSSDSLDSTVSSTTPTTTPKPTPTPTGLFGSVGGALDGLTSDVLGGGDGGHSSSSATVTPTTSILDPVTVTRPGSTTTSASDSTSSPTTTTSSSSSDGGILGGLGGLTSVLGPVTSVLGPVTSALDPVTSAVLGPVTSVLGPVTSALDPVTSAVIGPVTSAIDPVTSAVIGPVTSALGPVTSALSSVVGPVTSAVDPVTSILGPVTSALGSVTSDVISPVTSALGSVTSDVVSPITSVLGSVTSDVVGPVSSIISSVNSGLSSIISSTPISLPPTTTILPPISEPTPPGSTSYSDSGSFLPPSTSVGPIISFPTPSGNISTTTSPPMQSTPSAVTVTSTSVNTFSIEPGLSFVLTESSLAYTSIPTTTATLTDPDEATTTIDPFAAHASSTLVPVPLPTGIPARIYPRDQLDVHSKDLAGFTLISILFNNELNWPFVVGNTLASSQIFAYVPLLITTALVVPADQVKTYALQVYIPTSYQSPNDALELGTTWLGYIPSNMIDTLAVQIKAKSSTFYTGVPDGVAKDLADRVVPGYSLLSVSDPNANPGAVGPSDNGTTDGGGDKGKSRQDAIIGVVSALGAIALFVLVFLVYRSMKRRRQLAHRRLSDPPDEVAGARPDGRQFDQDSVGGARRRSFYFAEDSLRGFESQANANDRLMQEPSPTSMSQRRNIEPSAISAPVLRGSTMNW